MAAIITIMRLWPFGRRGAPEALVSISDPAAAMLFGATGVGNYSGVTMSESTAMGLSGMWRAISLLSGTLGQLPLKTYKDSGDEHKPAKSIFDDPDGQEGMTPFEWKRTIVVHHKIHGNIYLWKSKNQGGALARLTPVHPLAVRPREATAEEVTAGKLPIGGLYFELQLENGEKVTTDATDVLHIPGLSLDGKIGMSLVDYARNSLGTAVAGDRAAANLFRKGAMISGVISPESDADGFDSKGIKREVNRELVGPDNAGGIAVINRVLKFTPWTMTMQDAQFLQSRQFSIEEIARWTGVPPHLLMQTEKQTSWGTGVEQQNTGMSRTVLGPDASLYEQRFSRVLAKNTFVEFDFAGLERPSPETEIALLIDQWNADLLTLNEVRKVRNMPPIQGGDVVKTRWEAATGGQPAAV